MAEFQAKKLNANEINNGQKLEYGQSPSTETFNAPIEGCLYLQERSIKTEKELQNIKSVLLGNNQYVEIKTEDAYKSRITANGANIFDDQFARVTKIQGDTIKSKNIFNRYYGKRTGGSLITETTDEKIVVQQQDGRTYVSANIPLEKPEQYVGKTLYFSAKWTCSGANKGAIRVMWLNESTCIAGGQVKESTTSGAVVSGVVPARPANATGLYLMLYSNVDGTAVQGDTATYTDIMISTENVPYTPYFSGLKHTFFESIKSTGRNLVNFDEIAQNVVNQSTNSEIVTFDGKRCLKFLDIGNASIQTILPSGIIHGLRFKAYVDGNWFTSFASCKLSNGTNQYFGISEADGNKWVEFSKYFNDDRTIESFTFYAYNYQSNAPVYIDLDSVMFERSGTPTDYKPYKESIYKLPVPVELPEYDSVLPQEGKIIRATDTVTINGTTAKVAKSVDLGDWQLYTYTPNSNLSCVYGSQIVPMGWGSDTPANSVGFSKGVYLTNTNYVTIGVWFHKVDFLAETGVDTSNATAINEYFSNNPLIIERQLQNTNTLTLECPQYYKAWNNGTETVIQGATDNSEFGAMPTITQFYLGKVGE